MKYKTKEGEKKKKMFRHLHNKSFTYHLRINKSNKHLFSVITNHVVVCPCDNFYHKSSLRKTRSICFEEF